jgi:protein-disulfide isomerase
VLGGAALLLVPGQALALPEEQRQASELVNDIPGLAAAITFGNPRGDATLVEFFDYNCPHCRRSAAEIQPLLAGDKGLRYVVVNYAVLSPASVQATRVALGFLKLKGPRAYRSFHERVFAGRGVADAERTLAVATALGADRAKLIDLADSDETTAAMVAAQRLGEGMGLDVTPSFIAGTSSFQGAVTLAEKRKLIANLRACEQASCA